MDNATVTSLSAVTWGVAARALPGQASCGDLHLVKALGDGVLLAAVDGIGHGEEATVAAECAVATLECYASEPLVSLFRRCHAALAKTRGVVMTLAYVDTRAEALTWLGVGNVEALLARADGRGEPSPERALLRSGLVGYTLPPLQTRVIPLAPGDLLVFVTDGIGPGFARGWLLTDPPQQIADNIMDRHARPTDDALVLVARYLGASHE